MAAGTVCVTLPIVAAAAGLYLCDRKTHSKSVKENIDIGSKSAAIEVKTKVKAVSQMPKFAPQFDGLDCFETFVGRL